MFYNKLLFITICFISVTKQKTISTVDNVLNKHCFIRKLKINGQLLSMRSPLYCTWVVTSLSRNIKPDSAAHLYSTFNTVLCHIRWKRSRGYTSKTTYKYLSSYFKVVNFSLNRHVQIIQLWVYLILNIIALQRPRELTLAPFPVFVFGFDRNMSS